MYLWLSTRIALIDGEKKYEIGGLGKQSLGTGQTLSSNALSPPSAFPTVARLHPIPLAHALVFTLDCFLFLQLGRLGCFASTTDMLSQTGDIAHNVVCILHCIQYSCRDPYQNKRTGQG